MSWGILRKHLITGTFICGLALLTAQWAATQTRFNVQSSGRGLQNAKMGAQINQLQAENDAQQAELNAKKPHADAALSGCTGENKILWNGAAWGCVKETDPQVNSVANGKWCRGISGGRINCDQNAPGGGALNCTTRTKSCNVGHNQLCRVSCASGWIATGGGGNSSQDYNIFCRPYANGWECQHYNYGTITTQVRCCRVQ